MPVPLDPEGPEPGALGEAARAGARLFYGVPNSQNPSGTTWSAKRRQEVAAALGISYGNAKVVLHRARARLRGALVQQQLLQAGAAT